MPLDLSHTPVLSIPTPLTKTAWHPGAMDPRPARVPHFSCDPDRVVTMYGELGNKLVREKKYISTIWRPKNPDINDTI